MPDAGAGVRFFVPGRPATKGSMVAWKHPKTGRVVTRASNAGRQRSWTERIAAAVMQAGWTGTLEGAVAVRICCYLPRPKGHYGTGRNSRRLKPSAPAWPLARNRDDVDKLARCILDALTGLVWEDDSQVCSLEAVKVYASPYADPPRPVGAQVDAWKLDPA